MRGPNIMKLSVSWSETVLQEHGLTLQWSNQCTWVSSCRHSHKALTQGTYKLHLQQVGIINIFVSTGGVYFFSLGFCDVLGLVYLVSLYRLVLCLYTCVSSFNEVWKIFSDLFCHLCHYFCLLSNVERSLPGKRTLPCNAIFCRNGHWKFTCFWYIFPNKASTAGLEFVPTLISFHNFSKLSALYLIFSII